MQISTLRYKKSKIVFKRTVFQLIYYSQTIQTRHYSKRESIFQIKIKILLKQILTLNQILINDKMIMTMKKDTTQPNYRISKYQDYFNQS
ncbi:hypothetical protein FGO68_gene12485 [Halteria grandinella]|uniref:Uncharacterized protein n=1 Tax=Halteria grandinella TaxID=5974 RepID=A0A8J8NFS3_HALGN|nr:hypothetical protein FGO68_gene12485 [Halteria grandinella]